MTPQMYQSIKLMELPLVDLREKIEEELELNPALEVLEDNSTVSLDEAEDQSGEEEAYFEASSDSGFIHTGGSVAASDEHQRFIEGVLTRPETLQQHLLWQLQLEPVDDELRTIAGILIQNLDDDGFHKEPPETLFAAQATTLSLTVTPSRLVEAIQLVQKLDPAGCCTADYHESLKVQAALFSDAPACMESALDHLELLEREKFAEAAKKMNCSKKEVHVCFDLIKKLSPFPGRLFTAAEVRFVAPDVQVIRDSAGGHAGDTVDGSDNFVIKLNDEVIPVLGINSFFKKLEKRSSGTQVAHMANRPARKFAKENIREAQIFINSLALRNHTLAIVAGAIVQFQRSFFIKGPQYLVPLTLGDIAGDLGIHETTISRIANSKYMQTEWGIFEMRYFFTNSISGIGSSGSQFSKEGVKAIIQELISSEDEHVSDLAISELLAQRGISLARRTVAKYRKELDLGSSYTR
ncbi:MAG: RNA polymerase factor sigma-54 [Treponema sp.]|nr:RNA polymerase factor sigma-54 [Treponema sp.]